MKSKDQVKSELSEVLLDYLDTQDTILVFNYVTCNKEVLEDLWLDWADHEQDWRSGEDTYGFDNIPGQLEYISDRWKCAFRLRWLLDATNKAYKVIF